MPIATDRAAVSAESGLRRPNARQGLPSAASRRSQNLPRSSAGQATTRQFCSTSARLGFWHRPRIADDAMMRRARTPMTVSQLKRSIDRRFDRIDRRKADKSDLVRQRKDLRAEIATLGTDLRAEIAALRTELRDEISRSAAETRRHMEVIAESLRDDLRIFADAIGLNSERLNQHETRIDRLERRSI